MVGGRNRKNVLKVAVILVATACAIAPLPRQVVERTYSRGLYPILQTRLTALSNTTPFAWFDALVLLTIGATVLLAVARIRRGRAGAKVGGRTGISRTLVVIAGDTAAIAAMLYLWFLGTWGLNYQRQPLREQLDFREDRVTSSALRVLADRTVDSLNALYQESHTAGWPDLASTPAALEPAFVRAQRDLALPWLAQPGRPKRTLFNFYFTRVSIDGMTDPFFLETLTNGTLLPFERPATIAHEWSHLAGYADESEASFVGWLVCMRGTPPVQYSGWLSLYGTVADALPRSDRDDLARRLADGPRDDLRAISDRVRRHAVPAASRAGYALYDRFLKANRVEAGIRSYGEVLRLLLGTHFTEAGAPMLRK
jgi:hypothetical protein